MTRVALCTLFLVLGAACGEAGSEADLPGEGAAAPDGGEGEADPPAGSDDTATRTAPDTIDLPYRLTAAQEEAVRQLLRARPDWRVLTAEDNTSPLLERQQEQESGYRPYFLEADLTEDGAPDFALVLGDGEGTEHVVIFRRSGGGFVPATPVLHAEWLDAGGLFLDEGRLMVGEFFTDKLAIYRWDDEAQRFVAVTRTAPIREGSVRPEGG